MSGFREIFLNPLIEGGHYAMPPGTDEQGDQFAELLEKSLAGYSATALAAARDRLIAEATGYAVIQISRCKKACQDFTGKERSKAERDAEYAHLERLNAIHEAGDTDRAARLARILALRSHQTRGWDFSVLAADIRGAARIDERGREIR